MIQATRRTIEGLTLIVLAVTVLLAQGQRNGSRNYDPSTELTKKGTVENVQQLQGRHGWNGTHLILKADSENLEVDVGPSFYLTDKQFSFTKGDQLEILGSKVKRGTKEVLIAREITKDGNKLVLRNAQGIPMWAGRHGN